MNKIATVCLFAKPPRPGTVKTRLARSIGAGAAAALASAFIEDTWRSLRGLEWAHPVLAVTEKEGLPDLGGRPTVWLQGEGDLGARMERVLRRAIAAGRPAIAIGADSPGLPRRLLDGAARALRTADAVLGPAEDGGFYLLGLRACPAGVLEGLPWSVPETFKATAFRLASLRLRVAVLDPWFDVDRTEDLERLGALAAFGGLDAPATTRCLVELGCLPASGRRRCA